MVSAMAEWHLQELRLALEQAGWTVMDEVPSDGVRLAGTWQIQRSRTLSPLSLDFTGLDDGVQCLSMEEAYACSLREGSSHGLYFRGWGQRKLWREELASLIGALNEVETSLKAC
jgi:hypothetical protein